MAGGAADVGLAFLRLAGIGLATHGYEKVFGGRMTGFADGIGSMGFPVPMVFAWFAALSELVGGSLVAVGLYTRFAAVFAGATMFVAAFLRHANDAFDVREKALLYLVVMVALACTGAGKYSIDGVARKAA